MCFSLGDTCPRCLLPMPYHAHCDLLQTSQNFDELPARFRQSQDATSIAAGQTSSNSMLAGPR